MNSDLLESIKVSTNTYQSLIDKHSSTLTAATKALELGDAMSAPGDEHYIYLAAHYDNVFSKNAVEKYGGEQVLILIEIDKDALELDDLNQKYTKKNISLKDQEELHKALTQNIFAQCRTKTEIKPSQIVKVLQLPSKEIIFERQNEAVI